MIGLETYAATHVGVDWMNMASGVLKGAGGAFGGGGGGDAGAAEKARLEAERKAAEESARTWKLVGIGGVVVIAGYLLLRHKQAA